MIERNVSTQQHRKTRYLILLFDCLIGYGCYFNIDLPSALQDKIEGKYIEDSLTNSTNETSGCEDCLGLSAEQYNQLYAVYLWMNSALSLPMGYFIDRIGNRTAALISTLTSVLGTVSFSLAMIKGVRRTKAMFPLMITGRALLGAGTVSVRLVQDRIIAFWFPDRLELVFGMIVCVLRLGNVSNFLLTSNLSEWLSLQMAVWSGSLICSVGFLAAIFLACVDRSESQKVGLYKEIDSKSLRPWDARKFPVAYWFIVLCIMFFYSAYIPFVANGCKYIQQKFHYSDTVSSYINGASYDVAVLACPIVGILLNHYFRRYTLVTVGSFLLIPTYLLLILHPVNPIIITVLLGIVYSLVAVSIWPSIAKTVPLQYVGTANGIACTFDGIGSGLSSILVGVFLEDDKKVAHTYNATKWNSVFFFLTSCSVICFICGITLVCINKHKKSPIHMDKTISIVSPSIQQDQHEKQTLLNGHSNYGSVT